MLSRKLNCPIDGPLCVALGLLFTWNWIISQSPTNLTVALGAWQVPSRVILLGAMAVAGFVFFAVRRHQPAAPPRTRRMRRFAWAVGLGIVILAMDLVDGSFDGEVEGLPFAVQSVAMGVASAYLYREVGSLFAMVGIVHSRRVSVAAVLGLLLCCPLQVALYYVHGGLRGALMVAYLVAVPFFYDWLCKRDGLREGRREEQVRMPSRFVLTLLIMGVALGTLQGVVTTIMASEGHSVFNPLSTVGFLLAAFAAAATLLRGRFDYNHIIYQMGIPVLACGFAIVALGGNPFVGFVLCLAGYYTTFVTLWVLGAYLAAESPAMVRWLFALMAALMAAGQAIGLVAVDAHLFGRVQEDSVLMVVFLLLACLFMGNGVSPYESWGIVRPARMMTGLDLEGACGLLAAETRMTNREREILPLLAQGRNRKVIAEQLVLSENTVKTHISNLYGKVGVHTQQELIDLVHRRMAENGQPEHD